VLFLVVFVDRSQVVAPGEPILDDQAAIPEAVQTMSAARNEKDGGDPSALTAQAPAESQLAPSAAPMAAKMFAGPEVPTPSGEAEKIAQAYVANAEDTTTTPIDFKTLEQLLADAPKEQKQALTEFKTALESALAEKGSTTDAVAMDDFRNKVAAALEAFKAALNR